MIDFASQIGPYMGIAGARTVTFEDIGRSFKVCIYGAFNAYGAIMPEHNGILVLDEDRRYIVIDKHCKADTGYFGPTPKQVHELDRIAGLKWPEFREFMNGNRRCRFTFDEKGDTENRPPVY